MVTRLVVDSPVGEWGVEGDGHGVTRVTLPGDVGPRLTGRPSEPVTAAARQIREYLRGRRRDFDVVLAEVIASDFQRAVWDVVADIDFGSVATYGEVAAMCGRPLAARAVGNAVHVNPWPILVPCHRVVARHGLGGYAGAEDVKVFLLSLEGVHVPD